MIGADGKAFHEATRSVTVSYPIPFVLACLGGLALGCFGLATMSADPLIGVLTASAGWLSAATGIGVTIYAVGFKPELLRSERFNVLNRYIDLVGDDISRSNQRGLDAAMLAYLKEDVPKRATATRRQTIGANRDDRQ